MLPSDAAEILWGFFFFFGLAIALAVRKGLPSLGAAHLLDHGIQRRITGWSVDYLVATTALVVWLGRRLAAFPLERTAAIFTASLVTLLRRGYWTTAKDRSSDR